MGKRVIIMAGGTGGHVYPALAVALRLMANGHEVVWIGTRKGLEGRVIPAAGIPVEWLSVSGIRGKGATGLLKAPFMLMRALRQSWSIFRKAKPDVALGMGGFVSGPGGLVASILRIPLILHEQNRVPGTTNRLLARRAQVVLEAFPGSFPAKVGARLTGNPLRKEIAALPPRSEPWDGQRPINLLIIGGSLGAKALNETVPAALARIQHKLNIRHQTGEAMRTATAERYAQQGLQAEVKAFVDDMAEAYRWADIAICRAGAMTVSELAAAGLPGILVPYPHAIDDHQTQNAQYLADNGAAVLLPQTEMTPDSLAAALDHILTEPHRLESMARAARLIARPEAARVVADICLDSARNPRQS